MIYSTNGNYIETFVIDGCQYIGNLDGSENDWCTHKGTCNNPIHKTTYTDTTFYQQIIK